MADLEISAADVPKYQKVIKPDTLVKDKYYVLEKLGDGCYGEVYLVQDIKSKDGDIYALKSIQKKHFKGNRKLPYMLDKEAKIHRALNHPNIVRLYDYFEDDKYVFFLLEYITPGELFNILYEKDQFTEEEGASIVYQTAQALKCCQQHNVIHRDLKPENLLMSTDGTIKLADFGWATYRAGESVVGSVHYNAPEMLRYKRYDYRSDIWSLGVLVYELLCGEQPFKGKKKPGQSRKERERETELMIKGRMLRKTKYYQRLSPEAKDLIETILRLDPSKRPSYEQIFAHPWMQKYCPQLNPEAAERLRIQKLEEEEDESSSFSGSEASIGAITEALTQKMSLNFKGGSRKGGSQKGGSQKGGSRKSREGHVSQSSKRSLSRESRGVSNSAGGSSRKGLSFKKSATASDRASGGGSQKLTFHKLSGGRVSLSGSSSGSYSDEE